MRTLGSRRIRSIACLLLCACGPAAFSVSQRADELDVTLEARACARAEACGFSHREDVCTYCVHSLLEREPSLRDCGASLLDETSCADLKQAAGEAGLLECANVDYIVMLR